MERQPVRASQQVCTIDDSRIAEHPTEAYREWQVLLACGPETVAVIEYSLN
jgi:hypothetical protein